MTFTTNKFKVVPIKRVQRIVDVVRRKLDLVVNDLALNIQTFCKALFAKSASILEVSVPGVVPSLAIIEPPTKTLCHIRS